MFLSMKTNLKKTSFAAKFLLISLLAASWFLFAWPKVWQNPEFPPSINKASAVAETRYMRDDTQTVNGLTAYNAGTTQSTSGLSTDVQVFDGGGSTVYWGIRVWKRDSSGTETEITAGTPVAQVSKSTTGAEILSNTWTPTATSLSSSDAIVVRVYIDVGGTGTWSQGGTAPDFITEQLDAAQLDAAAWTVYYYVDRASVSTGSPSGRYTQGFFYWGTATYDSKITNFSYTPANITAGTTGSQVSSMSIPSSNQYVGGAFTFARDTGSADVTQIIVSETGTVNANSNISNLDIYYETAATCSYDGNETLFGTAATFDASENAAVTGTMSVGTSQVCVYVVLDVGSGALDGQTLEIEITDPSADVTVAAGTISPSSAVAIAGTTSLALPTTLTFTVSTDNFPSVIPGKPVFATTTLSVETNNAAGWNITLSGDDQGTNNTVMDLDTDPDVGIPDQAEWIPGSATTTPGNAVRMSLLDNSGNVLAFRVMTASGSPEFISTAWWGTADDYADNANTLWAGIASSTAADLKIGNSGVDSGGSPALNTVLYYLNAPATQKTGSYSGGLTYTATLN